MNKKTLKRILSVAITASVLMLWCLCTHAEKAPEEGSKAAAQERAYYYTQLEEKEKEIYEEIYTNLYEDTAQWTTDCHIAADRYIEIFDLVLNDHPEIFWVGPEREAAQLIQGFNRNTLFFIILDFLYYYFSLKSLINLTI